MSIYANIEGICTGSGQSEFMTKYGIPKPPVQRKGPSKTAAKLLASAEQQEGRAGGGRFAAVEGVSCLLCTTTERPTA